MGIRLDRRCAVRWTTLGALVAGTAILAGCGGSNLYDYAAPAAIVAADFTGSGYPAIAVAQAQINQLVTYEEPGYVAVALQNPSKPGTFEGSMHFATQGNPSAMTVGALTPGTLDLVVANVNDASVSILMQTAAGASSFQKAVNVSVIPSGVTGTVLPEDVAICDVNGDGYPDIVVAYVLEQNIGGIYYAVGGGVSLLEQNASSPGTFLPATLIGTTPTGSGAQYPNGAYGIACTNLSGSTTAPPDIVITSTYQYDESGDYGMVSIFPHNPASPGTFLAREDISVPGELHRVIVGDFNGDGLPDIAVGDESEDENTLGQAGIVVLLQQTPVSGATEPTFATPVPYVGNAAIALTAADVNGDGLLDIVTVTPGDSSTTGIGNVNVWINNPASPGTFEDPETTYAAISNPVAVTTGKFSSSSLPDIAIADGGGGGVLLNTASNPGTFGAPQIVVQ